MSELQRVPASAETAIQPTALPPQPQGSPIYGVVNPGPQAKICMLIPTGLTCDVRWGFMFPQLLSDLPPGSNYFADYRYGLAETREALVTQALTTVPDISHILFVDNDCIPLTPNPIKTLLSDDKPIITGAYFNSLFTGLAAWKNEAAIQIKTPNQPFLQECDKTGFGFTLIKREVFDAMKDEQRPWFYYTVDAGIMKMQSEDFYFIDKAKKYGYKPWVDLRVQLGHIKTVVINADGTINGPPPHESQQPTAGGAK